MIFVIFMADCRQEANGSDRGDLTERARAALHAGPPRRTIGNDDAIFDHDDPKIKEV
jgi:COMPASS component SWD3